MPLITHDGSESFDVGTTTANASPIPFDRAEGGRLYVPTGSALNGLTVALYDRPKGTSAWYVARNENDVAITFVAAAGTSRPVPYSLNAGSELCLVCTALGAAAPVHLVSKRSNDKA